jgi:hypothetical protein
MDEEMNLKQWKNIDKVELEYLYYEKNLSD